MAIEQSTDQKVVALAAAMRGAVANTPELPAQVLPGLVYELLRARGWTLIPVSHNRRFYDKREPGGVVEADSDR